MKKWVSNVVYKLANKLMAIYAMVFCIAILMPNTSFAILPVVDTAALAKLGSELKKLQQQYQLMQQQLDTAKEIASDAEGHYGFGDLLNGTQDLVKRQWSPNNWDDALKGLSGGNPARYEQLLAEYKQNHPTLSQSDYEKGESATNAIIYQQDVNTNRAASVNATYAFNTINKQLANVHELSAQIEKAKNTKAAMDLNSRLLTQVAYIQIQELKMQTVVNQQLAQSASDKIASQTAAAKFNRLPTS